MILTRFSKILGVVLCCKEIVVGSKWDGHTGEVAQRKCQVKACPRMRLVGQCKEQGTLEWTLSD